MKYTIRKHADWQLRYEVANEKGLIVGFAFTLWGARRKAKKHFFRVDEKGPIVETLDTGSWL